MHITKLMFSWLMSVFEWILSPLAWYRGKSGLDDVVTELQGLCADLAAERERMAVERQRMTADLERWAAEIVQMAADSVQECEQVGDAVFDYLTTASTSVTAPSTLSASKLTVSQLQTVLNTLNCMVAPVLGDPTTLDDLQELGQEFIWTPRTEASRAEGLIAHLKMRLTVPPGVGIKDTIRVQAANRSEALVQGVYGLDFKMKGKNDVLFSPIRSGHFAELYAFIGFKYEETLTPKDLEQAQAEFVTWGLQSYSAFIQVVSDARSGGVACWLDPDRVLPDKQLIRMQIFAGMPALYAFLDSALAALPASMIGFYSDGRPYEGRPTFCSEELQQPMRCKLDDPGLDTIVAKRDILKTFFGRMADDDPAEPDVALAAWFPDGGSEPVRFPDHPS